MPPRRWWPKGLRAGKSSPWTYSKYICWYVGIRLHALASRLHRAHISPDAAGNWEIVGTLFPTEAPADAARLISDRFGTSIPFPTAEAENFVDELGRLAVAGGAVYDALIGATCRACKGTMVTRDRRAVATYESLDVRYELVI